MLEKFSSTPIVQTIKQSSFSPIYCHCVDLVFWSLMVFWRRKRCNPSDIHPQIHQTSLNKIPVDFRQPFYLNNQEETIVGILIKNDLLLRGIVGRRIQKVWEIESSRIKRWAIRLILRWWAVRNSYVSLSALSLLQHVLERHPYCLELCWMIFCNQYSQILAKLSR